MRKRNILTLLTLSTLLLVLAGGALSATAQQPEPAPATEAAAATQLGTAFTYQGRLNSGGSPATGSYDFEFKLFDALSGGVQVGTTQASSGVAVSQGNFSVSLDFGKQFTGQSLWLEIGVRPAGGGAYTPLAPRQALSAAPYALGLAPGALVNGGVSDPTLSVINSGPGYTAIYGVNSSLDGKGIGVKGENYSFDGGIGVYGVGFLGVGVSGEGYLGVHGVSEYTDGTGVSGYTSATRGKGVAGQSDSASGVGVWGYAPSTTGSTYGMAGQSSSSSGVGTSGYASAGSGVTVGVRGQSDSPGGYGVYGYNNVGGFAGGFQGKVAIYGTLSKSAGSFQIDHPLDPANQYLYHSFVESPDMKNIYDGVVVLDSNGEATVVMPDWFQALNGGDAYQGDYRYQLTPIGAAMPGLYIAQEIAGNSFKIAGGAPGMKVSWQVTGIRHDAYAEANRIPVEQPKPANEIGTYLFPKLYGQPASAGVNYTLQQQASANSPTPLAPLP
jgi:hypothetical protein